MPPAGVVVVVLGGAAVLEGRADGRRGLGVADASDRGGAPLGF